ncbi:PhzF family phenazine biosynthesis protein [uncultured Cetobacterium sp.]|uniref:PhzF family phenazine biosynthesis protein n=1 Tax=uncultured Cetobacterium sp. TaxID=527638 RepID=UPI00262A1B3B|nr:PhzF family phenazine biosynthesis protein [uncultured Cetobacterium sp.]
MEYIVDVFTYKGKGGNKAGVVFLNDEYISKKDCQKIATKLNLSETVFVKKIDTNIFELRFFTSKCEIDFCGHASLGAFYVLKKMGIIETGEFIERLKIRDLNVIVEENKIFLEQDDIAIYGVLNEEEIIESIGVSREDLDKNFNIVVGYSGLRDILIPVKNRKILNSLKIDLKRIEELSKVNSVVGYHIYCIEEKVVYCRNFAPLYGIEEESATGSSNGALFGYIYINSIEKNFEPIAFQGENYGQISQILGKILIKHNKKIKVYIGSEFEKHQ